MPVRTRADMHIGIDLGLEILNATPFNRLDPAIKDYFLNKTISEFVKNVIAKANKPDENKRVPFRILTYGDISAKYNDIYTLIKVDDNILPLTEIDNSFYQYILPSDLFRFESSFANVRPIGCITYPSAGKPTLANSAGAGTVDAGIHYYAITFVYPTLETDVNGINIASLTVGTNKNVELTAIPIGLTGCTARKIYRSKLNDPWHRLYYVGTVAGNTTQEYTDSATDASLTILYSGNTDDIQLPNGLLDTHDIMSFNLNPYGGGGMYMGTILESNSTLLSGNIRLYHLGRYAISRFGVIYIKKPAILTDSPGTVNCDLPDSVHDRIIDDTVKFIAATANSNNYQQLLMEAKQQNQ
jgi:hypothetical protein